jgi:hypothetical protein
MRTDGGLDGERLPVGAVGPVDRHRILVVVPGPRSPEGVGDRERLIPRHHDRLRQEPLVVAIAVPGHGTGRGAAFAVDGRVAVDRLDEFAPDLGVVDHQPAVGGHIVGFIGVDELPDRVPRVDRADRHGKADAPDVIAAQRCAHRRLYLIALERPEDVPPLRDVGEREVGALEQAFPDMDRL